MPGQQPTSFAVVGDNTIDRYLGERDVQYAGGNALNVAAQLSAHDERVGYYGAIGLDADGGYIEGVARAHGIELAGLSRMPGATAVTRIRLEPSGDRVFEREDFGVTVEYFPDDAAVERIAAADRVHIGMLPRAAELVEELRGRNPSVAISQDCAVSRGYRGLDVAFCSVGEGSADPHDRALEAIAGGARVAVVTRGADGALAFDGDRWWERVAVPITPVDTTGAGDSFIAGFIRARRKGATVPESLDEGAAWAAATCLHVAGFPQ
jgi:Sugar kinases, ribokinase family